VETRVGSWESVLDTTTTAHHETAGYVNVNVPLQDGASAILQPHQQDDHSVHQSDIVNQLERALSAAEADFLLGNFESVSLFSYRWHFLSTM
jgi:hypothetical protein